jgi:hypothetical protein
MSTTYIISQILAFTAFILSLFAYYRSKKEKIMLTMVTSNILNLIHYILLWATTGYITKILAILRDVSIVLKDKRQRDDKILLIGFIIIYIIVAIFTYENIYSLLPLAAALIYIISIWNWNEWAVKKSAFFCYFLRLIYNIFVWSIVATIATIISIISTFIALLQYNKKQKNIKKIKIHKVNNKNKL